MSNAATKLDFVQEIPLDTPFVPIMCRLNSGSSQDLALIDFECNTPPWSEKLFSKEFENPASLVYGARATGELLGFLVTHAVIDEAHILNFGVRRSFRGLGVGKSLLSHTLKDLAVRGVRWVTLEVRESNLPAQKLYGRFGFFEIGKREKYYTDNNEDALVLGLNIRQFLSDHVLD